MEPVALFALHVDQWVALNAEFASAHEITKLLGRDTVVSAQVRSLTADAFGVEAPELGGAARTGAASAAASAKGAAMRTKRDMMTSFFDCGLLMGEHLSARCPATRVRSIRSDASSRYSISPGEGEGLKRRPLGIAHHKAREVGTVARGHRRGEGDRTVGEVREGRCRAVGGA